MTNSLFVRHTNKSKYKFSTIMIIVLSPSFDVCLAMPKAQGEANTTKKYNKIQEFLLIGIHLCIELERC